MFQKLSDEPKNARIDPEFVKQSIYLIHPPAQGIKNSQLNCSTRAKPINRLKVNPHMYNLYFSDEPKNTINGPEPVKQEIYLMHPSCIRDDKTRNLIAPQRLNLLTS